MSAITKTAEAPELSYGISSYHTRIKVLVHSHANSEQAINLSDDVAACQLSKNIKGAGQASLTIVPRRNYMNLVSPNDHINIYFDTCDGNGWTRTFYGLVDRIEESYNVGDDGAPTTTYSLVATDFTKIFAKTEVYFNPHMSQRRDVRGTEFGAINIGGLALMSSGLTIHGSPDAIVLNTIMVLLGFGSQFMMPSSYPVPTNIIMEARAQRQRAALRLVQAKIKPEQLTELTTRINLEASSQANALVNSGSMQEISRALLTQYGINPSELNTVTLDNRDLAFSKLNALISNALFRKQLNIPQGLGGPEMTFQAINRTTQESQIPSILDYMDLFSFVEHECIDGYVVSVSITDHQGPILSLLMSRSNEAINELFFDLRPRHNADVGVNSPSKIQDIETDDWDRSPDDIRENIGDAHTTSALPGIRYVPSVIMREYPFGTVDKLDASQVPISITATHNTGNSATERNQENAANNVNTVGPLYLGAVFSDRPNVPGRHFISAPNYNVEDRASGTGAAYGRRVLDVAVISEKEIKNSSFGRSDEDHVNFLEMWSNSINQGSDARWFMMDICPIITPVHVMRHGLRKRSIETEFARFDRSSTQDTSYQPGQVPATTTTEAPNPDNPAQPETTQATSNLAEGSTQGAVTALASAGTTATSTSPSSSQVQTAAGGGSVAVPSTSSTTTVPARPAIPAGQVVWPVNTRRNGRLTKPISSKFGYRKRRNVGSSNLPAEKFQPVSAGGRPDPNGETPSNRWIFHNGVDIPAPPGTSVHAAMDGKIVVVGFSGMYTDYGNIIVIKHTDNTYTVYAHLKSINANIADPVKQILQANGIRAGSAYRGSSAKRCGIAREFSASGVMTAIPVRAGDMLGTVGTTRGITDSGEPTNFNTGAHLHFEHTGRFPAKNLTLTPHLNGDFTETELPNWRNLNTYSYDPLTSLNLQRARHPADDSGNPPEAVVTEETADDTVASDEMDGSDTNSLTFEAIENGFALGTENLVTPGTRTNTQGNTTTAQSTQAETNPNAKPLVAVQDGISSRRTLARWAILQDHWYQHNTEYLSGSIEMRPAPEIRVGYRLDIQERNMSFYVEGVAHRWSYPDAMITQLTVTRGQPNNPYPAYILPGTDGFNPKPDQRGPKSRLGKNFVTPDPIAVRRSIAFRQLEEQDSWAANAEDPTHGNLVDLAENLTNEQVAVSVTNTDVTEVTTTAPSGNLSTVSGTSVDAATPTTTGTP